MVVPLADGTVTISTGKDGRVSVAIAMNNGAAPVSQTPAAGKGDAAQPAPANSGHSGACLVGACHGNSYPNYPENAAGAYGALSFFLDNVPGIGTIKSGEQVVTGKDPVTGEETSRGMSLLGAIPLVGGIIKLRTLKRV